MKRRIGWALIGIVIMTLLLTGVVTMARTTTVVDLIREDQKSAIERSKITKTNTETIKRVAEQIESCTNPAGECYKRGQERTGKAVASINQVIILAAVCAKEPGNTTAPQIRACIEALLPEPE